MTLTTQQLSTLKTDIAANTNTVLIRGVLTVINVVPNTPDSAAAIAGWYNLTTNPNYYVIRTEAPISLIENAILWPNYTPNPAVTSVNAAQATGCAIYCQNKQINLQLLLQKPNQFTFDATNATQTAGLKDATTQLPSGAAFALQGGGWVNILPLLSRIAINVEKLFATTAASASVPALYDGSSVQGLQGNPSVMGYEGSITYLDVQNALSS